METSGPKDRWKSERIKTRKVKQEDISNIGTGFHWGRGRMWTDLDIGPVKRGIRRWRDRVVCRERGKCRVYRVGAQIP